uniref:Uncharacterized protein n=1 Tax=Anguilla anguilla TaxID=7936 RepID=A0A0E9QG56_ANGAN
MHNVTHLDVWLSLMLSRPYNHTTGK